MSIKNSLTTSAQLLLVQWPSAGDTSAPRLSQRHFWVAHLGGQGMLLGIKQGCYQVPWDALDSPRAKSDQLPDGAMLKTRPLLCCLCEL